MFFATAIVVIPFIYLKYGKLKSIARALRVVRIEFVLTAIWCVILTLISMALSIEVGLRNCDPLSDSFTNYTQQPDNSSFINGLPTTCRTERAGNAFGWFAVGAWLISLGLVGMEWRDRRRPLPKHDAEVTMHTNSTRSSLEIPVTEVQYKSQHEEQVHMSNVVPQPEQLAYDYQHPQHQPPGEHGTPAIYPAGMPFSSQQSSGGSGSGGVNFPQPHHY